MAASRNRLPADLAQRVGEFLAARVGPGAGLAVGLSGGCDSVVLLHAVAQLGYRQRLQAIHVHHGLSPNADRWAAFCADCCAGLGIPLVIHRVAVDRDSGRGLEAAARAARYGVFAEAAADCLLLAHHRGDQAETVLFNLLRGAGVTGAAGMPAERPYGAKRLLRPLLDCSRAEIEAYARFHGLGWIDDESNRDTSFSRNFLRHEALVALSERFPMAESSLARAATHFGEAQALLDELAAADWLAVSRGDAASVPGLRALSPARVKNLLRHRLRALGWQVPVAGRLDEFVRQVFLAAPDRHPELALPDGRMIVARGLLHWRSVK